MVKVEAFQENEGLVLKYLSGLTAVGNLSISPAFYLPIFYFTSISTILFNRVVPQCQFDIQFASQGE